jgi:hypothetical protein
MKLSRLILALPCLLASSVVVCAGQTVEGHIFRSEKIGLTYAFPENFSAKVESELPMHDSTGREHMILALWNSPERSGSPRITFLYDTKARSGDLSNAEIANRYLAAVRQLWANVRGVKIFGPQKISLPGCDVWRLDLFQPDQPPYYNAAIVVPLADRRLLAIELNAPSQTELDAEVDSLRGLRLDRK